MRKRSLLFDAQQDGVSPSEERSHAVGHAGVSKCRALVKFEPAPEWLILYFKSDVEK